MKKTAIYLLLMGHSVILFGQHTAQNITSYGINAGKQSNRGAFFGYNTGTAVTGDENTFFGDETGVKTTTGAYNVFLGSLVAHNNTTGASNTFVGRGTAFQNSTGNWNSFLGRGAGLANQTGSSNVFLGAQAGYNNNNGNNNVYIGHGSGTENYGGSNNIYIGYTSGWYETGSNKLIIDNSSTRTPLIFGDFSTNQLGINTNTIPDGYDFAVEGKIIAEAMRVQVNANWPDYVFNSDYMLPSLAKVEAQIKEKGHLPGIPDAKTVKDHGIELGDMNARLLQKIEELTLYIIQQNKRIDALEHKNKLEN